MRWWWWWVRIRSGRGVVDKAVIGILWEGRNDGRVPTA